MGGASCRTPPAHLWRGLRVRATWAGSARVRGAVWTPPCWPPPSTSWKILFPAIASQRILWPEGLSHPVVSPFSGYRTRDGLIFVAISNTNRYRMFVEAFGRADLAEDPRFVENKDRVENDDALREILENILNERTTTEWEEFLIPQGVTVSAINDVARVKERFPEVFVEVDHPVAGPALLWALP
ncbi:CoA transferase [Nitrospinota bacterium]